MSSLTTLRRALARATVIALLLFLLIAVVALRKALYYAAEPDGEKDCPPVVPAGADPPRPVRIRPVVPASLVWVQRGARSTTRAASAGRPSTASWRCARSTTSGPPSPSPVTTA